MAACAVRPLSTAHRADRAAWLAMRTALWPDEPEEHARAVDAFLAGDRANPAEVLLAVAEDGAPLGFAELSLRTFAEGCADGPIGYLEGWYVAPAHRRSGVGGALVRAAEAWSRARGCAEMASDTEVENARSAAAHRALGFEEVGRVLLFRKSLRDAGAGGIPDSHRPSTVP